MELRVTNERSSYVVYFDDGTMLGRAVDGTKWHRFVREFPDAIQFRSKRAAEAAARYKNKPSTVERVACA